MTVHDAFITDAVEPRFRETQRFTQPWLWLLMAVIVGGVGTLTLILWLNGQADALFIAVMLVSAFIGPLILLSVWMVTEVRSDGVYVRFAPFHRRFRRFAFSDVDHFELVTYCPIKDYGGWGIRWSTDGWAYNVSGNIGVRVHLREGKPVLIGTRRGEELLAAIHAAQAAKR